MSDMPRPDFPFSSQIYPDYSMTIGEFISLGGRALILHPYTLVLAGMLKETPAEGARRITKHVLRQHGYDYNEVMA